MRTTDNSSTASASKMTMGHRVLLCLAGCIAATSLAAGLASTPALADSSSSSADEASSSATETETSTTATDDTEDLSLAEEVAAKCVPSVGTVTTVYSSPSGSGMVQGSCVVIDEEGYLITNYHVLEGATKVVVTLNDKTYDAEIVGSDPSSDIAVLKIDPGDDELTAIEIGDSDDLERGQWVMTIGTPEGMDATVATGVVSGLNRSATYQLDTAVAYYPGLIQTDAMINSGSSGGALVNSDGELIGITTISYSSTGDYAGITAAIPSNYAIKIANQIIENGEVSHPFMGVTTTDVDLQNYSNVSSETYFGAYVVSVVEGSPAEDAGIQAGDIITAVDGETIYSSDGLTIAIRSHDEGDTVTVTVDRNGETIDLELTLASDLDFIDSDSTTTSTSSTTTSTDESESSSSDEDSSSSSDSTGGILSIFGGDDSSGTSSDEIGSGNGYGYGYEDYNGFSYGYSYGGGNTGYGYSGGNTGYGYNGIGGNSGYGYGYGLGYSF